MVQGHNNSDREWRANWKFYWEAPGDSDGPGDFWLNIS